MVALALARHTGHERIKALLLLGLAGAPSLIVLALTTTGTATELAGDALQDDPFRTTWLSLSELVLLPARCFGAGPLWRSAPPPLLALGGLLLTFARARRGSANRTELALAWAALLLLVLSLATPLSFEIWKLMSPRPVSRHARTAFPASEKAAQARADRVARHAGRAESRLPGFLTQGRRRDHRTTSSSGSAWQLRPASSFGRRC